MGLRINPFTGQFDFVGASGGGGGSTLTVDQFTLSNTDITNKYVTLSMTPNSTPLLVIETAPGQFYGVDYSLSGNQLTWASLALDGILSSGDKLTVLYST